MTDIEHATRLDLFHAAHERLQEAARLLAAAELYAVAHHVQDAIDHLNEIPHSTLTGAPFLNRPKEPSHAPNDPNNPSDPPTAPTP